MLDIIKKAFNAFQERLEAIKENEQLQKRYRNEKWLQKNGVEWRIGSIHAAYWEIKKEYPFYFDNINGARDILVDHSLTMPQRQTRFAALLDGQDFKWLAFDQTVETLQQTAKYNGGKYPKPYQKLEKLASAKDPEKLMRRLKSDILVRTIHFRAKAIDMFCLRDVKNELKKNKKFTMTPALRYYGDRESARFIYLFHDDGYDLVIKYGLVCRLPPLYPGDPIGIEYFRDN